MQKSGEMLSAAFTAQITTPFALQQYGESVADEAIACAAIGLESLSA